MLTLKTFPVNFIEENCYVLSDESGEAVIIDCGAFFPEEKDEIRNYIAQNKLIPRHHLCTHGHFDHIFGAQFLAETYGIQPKLCADEVEIYEMADEQMRQFLHRALPLTLPKAGATFTDGESITFGSHTLRVIATPGHTPGGCCFYCEEEGILLSGDSLFRCSIGRCDLPGGNGETLVSSLKQRILTLPDNVKVYPGHGPSTTIAEEKTNNPYL